MAQNAQDGADLPMEQHQEDEEHEPTEEEIRQAKIESALAWKTYTVAQKKAVLAKYQYWDYFTVGNYVDACDTTGSYMVAKIIEINGNQMQINFDGWSNKWNMWYKVRNYKVCAFRNKTVPYTGQTSVALRPYLTYSIDLLRSHRDVLEDLLTRDLDGLQAFRVVQYFRGELFIFVDHIMGSGTYVDDPDELEEINNFLKLILKMIVKYLQRLPEWRDIFEEAVTEGELWLVCPQHALTICYAEFAEMLKKIFGGCHRAIRYYYYNDSNQTAANGPQSLVVKNHLDVDFEAARLTSQEFDQEEAKKRVLSSQIEFGQLFNFVQYFHDIGGFAALIHAINMSFEVPEVSEEEKKQESPEQAARKGQLIWLPLPLISNMLKALQSLRSVLKPEFAQIIVEKVRAKILGRLTTMNEKDIKELNKDEVSKVFYALRLFLKLGMSDEAAAREIESAQLSLALRFLTSNNLEKRLKGLNDIRLMIDMVISSAKFKGMIAEKKSEAPPQDNLYLGPLEEEEDEKPAVGQPAPKKKFTQPSQFMKTSSMMKWLIDNKVLSLVMGENAHIELVKRSGTLLKFLIKYGGGAFDTSCVDIVWKCQDGKHEEMVRTVYTLIQDISSVMNQRLINEFFVKIAEVPRDMQDEKFMNFLKEFTRSGLERAFVARKDVIRERIEGEQRSRGEDPTENFEQNDFTAEQELEEDLAKVEQMTVRDLRASLGALEDGPPQECLYGLPIFWSMVCDQDPNMSSDILDIALNGLKDLFNQKNAGMYRLPFALKALKNILESKAIVQSITILTTIIKCYNNDAYYWPPAEDDMNDESEDLANLAYQLQHQMNIVQFLIEDCDKYNMAVADKLKLMATKGEKMPEKVDDFCFSGKDKHSIMIDSLLDLIEFLVIASENKVEIGFENIEKLWHMFVSEPNFESDQSLFLNWVNKHRTKTDLQKRVFENFLFTDAEKEFLFLRVLCNQEQHMNPETVTLAQGKCFKKYFCMVNQSKNFLMSFRQRVKVVRFEGILGMDALWNFATQSKVEKARTLLTELLVDCHLRFLTNGELNKLESRKHIPAEFVQRCMVECEKANLDKKKGVVELLCLFLDRFEGIKPIEPDHHYAIKFPQMKAQNIDVRNFMPGFNSQEGKIVQVTVFQPVGMLRKKIAAAYDIQINEFVLVMKSQIIDPDDDHRHMKDFGVGQALPMVFIKANDQYDKTQHPKLLISQNQKYFDSIFSMLRADQPDLLLPVWDLIQKIPVSETLLNKLKQLPDVRAAKETGNPAQLRAAWNQMFDSSNLYKLLYTIDKVSSHFLKAEPYAAASPSNAGEMEGVEVQAPSWKEDFIMLGGFEHLLSTLINLEITTIDNMLTLQCITQLIQIIMDFLGGNQGGALLSTQSLDNQKALITRTLQLIEQIINFSIEVEAKRGHGYEDIMKRLQAAKQKQRLAKLRLMGNKGGENAGGDDADAGDNTEDNRSFKKIINDFREEGELVSGLFNLLNTVLEQNFELAPMLVEYPSLEEMLIKGMVVSENLNLRMSVCNKISLFIMQNANVAEIANENRAALFRRLLSIKLFSVCPKSQTKDNENNARFRQYFESINNALSYVRAQDMSTMTENITPLMQSLAHSIISRDINENTTANIEQDFMLRGFMLVLTKLLQLVPEQKLPIGTKLVPYMIHQCLFETPVEKKHNQKGAPKCKNEKTRAAAFDLLSVLCRDCLESLEYVFAYLHKFNLNPTWRTNKDSDWKVKFYDEEKSSTGYVGLKNLGCICYMNSVNQQLFMIPGFRNDILSIKDPNNNKDGVEDNFFLQWQNMFANLLLSEKMHVNPKAYCHSFKDWEGNPVNVIEQMDVEEYLNMFLDKLENAIKGTPQEKSIHYHFGGVLANEIVGKSCPHKYERKEPMLNIGLTVKNKKSVYEGLQTFITGDMLEADNAYQCEKCDKKVDALKRVCIKKLPRYLLVTMKRFEFDFDTMQRCKLNDYYEFPMDLDVSAYTQEFLTKKEAFEKGKVDKLAAKEEGQDDEEILAGHKQEPLKHPEGYYNYELVGSVVHTGTADMGHYYSYIREQQHEGEKDKWYEFNDSWVRDFDPTEIPEECYGGEETFSGMFQNNQKMMRHRNSYICVYRRKLQSDVEDEEDEEEKTEQKEETEKPAQPIQLGRLDVDLAASENPLLPGISFDNHKFWQNRFLFNTDYASFVETISLAWTTNFSIPSKFSYRNIDWHLMQKYQRQNQESASQPLPIATKQDAPIDLNAKYSEERLNKMPLEVFKFFAQYYLTVLQRNFSKAMLPQLNRNMKSYLNCSMDCCEWLIKQFTNWQLIKEQILENTFSQARWIAKFVVGLLYCAMIQIYEKEKSHLCDIFADLEAKEANPDHEFPERPHSVLGNFICLLLNKLPVVAKDYSGTQSQFLQLLARFVSLGPEARLFLLRFETIGRLLNMFYNEPSPTYKGWFVGTTDKIPVWENLEPDIGLPTPEEDKPIRGALALSRERTRLLKLQSENPKWKYLLRTIGFLFQSVRQERTIGEGEDAVTKVVQGPYALEDSGYRLAEYKAVVDKDGNSVDKQFEVLLHKPGPSFICALFEAARKPHAYLPLVRGYMNFAWQNKKTAQTLFQVIDAGLDHKELDNTPQYFKLLDHMLAATQCIWHNPDAENWLAHYVKITVPKNDNYYLWMDQVIEWIFRSTSKNPFVKNWFETHRDEWGHIYEWCRQTRDPPSQFMTAQKGSRLQLHKKPPYQYGGQVQMEDPTDRTHNIAVQIYRCKRFQELVDPPEQPIDRFMQVDKTDLDFHDFKWEQQGKVEMWDNNHSFEETDKTAVIVQVLDEMIQIAYDRPMLNTLGQRIPPAWINTDNDKLKPAKILAGDDRICKVAAIEGDLREKHRIQMQKQQQANLQATQAARQLGQLQDRNAASRQPVQNQPNREGDDPTDENGAADADMNEDGSENV